MRAIVHLDLNELTEAVLEYLDNNSANIKVPEFVGLKVEFTYRYENGNASVDGVQIIVDEKLVKDNS